MRYISAFIILFFLLTTPSFGQDTLRHKRQLGLNASRVFQLVKDQENSFDLINFKYLVSNNYNLRLGLNYFQSTADDGYIETGLKVGFDRSILVMNKFILYAGFDIHGSIRTENSSDRKNVMIGFAPFIGVLYYYIYPNLSVSMEPNVYVLYKRFIDDRSFSTDNSEEWYEIGIGNIGQLQINVHF